MHFIRLNGMHNLSESRVRWARFIYECSRLILFAAVRLRDGTEIWMLPDLLLRLLFLKQRQGRCAEFLCLYHLALYAGSVVPQLYSAHVLRVCMASANCEKKTLSSLCAQCWFRCCKSNERSKKEELCERFPFERCHRELKIVYLHIAYLQFFIGVPRSVVKCSHLAAPYVWTQWKAM